MVVATVRSKAEILLFRCLLMLPLLVGFVFVPYFRICKVVL